MDKKWILALSGASLVQNDATIRKLHEQHLVPLDVPLPAGTAERQLLLKFRDSAGKVRVDPQARITGLKGKQFIKSQPLSKELLGTVHTHDFVLLECEEAIDDARAIITVVENTFFTQLQDRHPELRLLAYDLPPSTSTLVEAPDVLEAIGRYLRQRDQELFSVHAEAFLSAPHILIPLFSHVMTLSSEDNLRFPTQLKKLADQFRALLEDPNCKSVGLRRVERAHRETWEKQRGKRIAFLDGGMARIASLPGTDPLALRVGVYAVRPGDRDIDQRENWTLMPYVLGDLTTPAPQEGRSHREQPNPKRLQEAARYVLEPLSGLEYLRHHPDVSMLLMHGPLINQFAQYDEGEPNWLPCLKESFLARHEITRLVADTAIGPIPSIGDASLWNQFMAVYGVVSKRTVAHTTPIAGVVERTAGSWLANELLRAFVADGLILDSYRKKVVDDILNKYDISDDFLFGCVLREGEYLTPITLGGKNLPRRARPRWQDVVARYPSPSATVLKTTETAFPFRIELNDAAVAGIENIMQVMYHTARLLPRYAFPVGLDIVDKFAKIPDWIARGVSSRITADVLKRALSTGDPNVVNQVRLFLARSPRDFFYRPKA